MNMAESVRQRLLNIAHKNAEPFDQILTRYALERLKKNSLAPFCPILGLRASPSAYNAGERPATLLT